MKDETNWSRRDFLTAASALGAAIALRPLLSNADDETDSKVAALVKSTLGVDTHNHIDLPLAAADVPGPDLDLAGQMKTSGLSAICATFALDYQQITEPGVAYDRFQNALSSMDAQLARNHMQRSLNLKDLQNAHEKGQPTIVQAVEGGHFLEGKLDRLEAAHKRGLRVLGMMHDSDASVPLGDIYTRPAHLGGLTEFGTDVVKECNRLGILIDLTHASVDAVSAALKLSDTPVVFSHTGLDTRLGSDHRMGQMMKPRLISREHARTIADAGGVVGVWTHLVDSAAEYVQAIRDMVDVVGVDHVCIGTDTKLTPGNMGSPAGGGPAGGGPAGGGPGPQPTSRPADDSTAGPRPAGGNQRGPIRGRIGERTNQAWADQKVGFYYAVVGEMLKQGLSPEDIGKIGGGNFCRVFGVATAGH